jgi:hypothetical protein
VRTRGTRRTGPLRRVSRRAATGSCLSARSARALASAWLIAAVGCGGATFQNGIFQDDHTVYRFGPLGPEWERVEVGDNDLAWSRPGMGTISVNSTCTEYEDVPVAALVNHLLFDTTKRRFLVEEDVTLDGRGARHVIVQVELDGVPLEIELFVMKKDGCVFDLGHLRGLTTPPAGRADFLRAVHNFAVLEVRLDG